MYSDVRPSGLVPSTCRFVSALLAGVLVGLLPIQYTAGAAAAEKPHGVDDVLTIYHLEGRRSIRVIWLCEELGIPYKLMFKPGDFKASAEMMRAVNPLMPMWPTVVWHGHVLVESGGILELLLAKYGNGRLQPTPASDDFPYYLQWMHFAEGTGMYRMWAARYAALVAGIPISEVPAGYEAGTQGKDLGSNLIGVKAVLAFMDAYLAKHPYFGGAEFSAADIMMHFVANASKITAGVDSNDYAHIVAWRKNVESRPAFKRAMAAAVPQGYNEYGLPAGMPLPFSGPPGPPLRAQPGQSK
jgi:glutathione S-transferase